MRSLRLASSSLLALRFTLKAAIPNGSTWLIPIPLCASTTVMAIFTPTNSRKSSCHPYHRVGTGLVTLPSHLTTRKCSSLSGPRPITQSRRVHLMPPPHVNGLLSCVQRILDLLYGPPNETERANVLVFSPEGEGRRIYASGIRNCVGMADKFHQRRSLVFNQRT